MVQLRQRGIEPAVMIENCFRAINIEGRSKLPRHPRKIDIFAVETPVAVMKGVHAESSSSL
jgi:hypothetical protein